MKFSKLKIGDKFCFQNSTVYKKVSRCLYTYDSDTKAVWKYWTPNYTNVNEVKS